MSQFDMNKFASFLNGKNGKKDASGEERAPVEKLRFFKVNLGETYIRWLPYVSDDGFPAFCVWFYDNQEIFKERRVVAPFQFGQEDPIAEYVEQRRSQGRLKEEEFKQVMRLTPKPSWFIPLAVRGKESEGAFLWEVNDKKFKELALNTIANPEYREFAPIFDPEEGRDILINAKVAKNPNGSDKIFMGKKVTEWSPTVRVKASKLAKTAEEIETIVKSIQNPVEYNKQWVRKPEFYQNLLTTALAFYSNGGSHEGPDGNGISRGVERTRAPEGSRDAVESALDSAFDDDDDGVF